MGDSRILLFKGKEGCIKAYFRGGKVAFPPTLTKYPFELVTLINS